FHVTGVQTCALPIFIDEYKGLGSKDLYVTPENFEKQMMYLRDHDFTLLTFDRWQDIDKVSKPIFITFDDGYQDNLNAFEIFQKQIGRATCREREEIL